MEPTTGQGAVFKSIIVTFPNLNPTGAANVVDEMQRTHKVNFVRQGLMLGEFHSKKSYSRLAQSKFLPAAHARAGALAIRDMVDSATATCKPLWRHSNAPSRS